MTPKTFHKGKWLNLDGTAPTYDDLVEIAATLEGEMHSDWRYSHDEIEASCGGETALAVRAKVMQRRTEIISRGMASSKPG